jgi:hypothetical protein
MKKVKAFSITVSGAKGAKNGARPRMALRARNAFADAFQIQLKAKTKRDMINGLYVEGAKSFVASGGAGYIFSTRWERSHRPKGIQVGASVPGFGVGKLIGDKLQHRWVVNLTTSMKDGVGKDYVCGFEGKITCRELSRVLVKYYDGGGMDAAGRSNFVADVMGHIGTALKLIA